MKKVTSTSKKTAEGYVIVDRDNFVTYTVDQMAYMLQLSQDTVRGIIKKRKIPTVSGVKTILVTRENFDYYFDA